MSATRADVVRVARSYIGTPFHHAARAPGKGLDCAGLVICAMRALALVPPAWDVQDYPQLPDGSFVPLCDRHLVNIRVADMRAGDVAVLAYGMGPQHMGVIADCEQGPSCFWLVHASNRPSVRPARVIESRFVISRAQRLVAAYSIPGVA